LGDVVLFVVHIYSSLDISLFFGFDGFKFDRNKIEGLTNFRNREIYKICPAIAKGKKASQIS